MTTRGLRESDIPVLQRIADSSGLPYPDFCSKLIEHVQVVVDDEDTPISAFIAEKRIQAYLLIGEMEPFAKLHAIRMLHDDASVVLKTRGWREVDCFLPPAIALNFGRRLQRTFGWKPNWPSFFRRF